MKASESQSLCRLEESLDTLNSYQLPNRYFNLPTSSFVHEGHDDDTTDHDTNTRGKKKNDTKSKKSRNECNATLATNIPTNLIRRYETARSSYLRNRIESLFLEFLPTYDPTTGTFAHPPLPTAQEEEDMKEREVVVANNVIQAVDNVEERYQSVRTKYDALVERRDELKVLVSDLRKDYDTKDDDCTHGKKNRKNLKGTQSRFDLGDDHADDNDDDDDDDDDNDDNESVQSDTMYKSQGSIDEEDMSIQEQRLEDLIRRRNELRAKLRSIRADVVLGKTRCDEAKKILRDKRRKSDFDLPGCRSFSPDTVAGFDKPPDASPDGDGNNGVRHNDDKYHDDDDDNDQDAYVEELRKKSNVLRSKAAEYREMADYYNDARELVENLCGIRILGVEDLGLRSSEEYHHSSTDIDDATTNTSMTEMVEKAKECSDKEELCVKVEILSRHVLRIGLGPDLNAVVVGAPGALRAVTARFLTDTIVTDATAREDDSDNDDDDDIYEDVCVEPREGKNNKHDDTNRPPPEATVSLPLPSPDDLVHTSRSLPPAESVRFIVRECAARIRATVARASNLARLKVLCMTKIYPQAGSDRGLEQQVVCSLPHGVTVALRLSADCPILPGSVRFDQILGVGGWDQKDLDEMRERVNGQRLASPFEMVESLLLELDRAVGKGKEEGGAGSPITPQLPKRRRG